MNITFRTAGIVALLVLLAVLPAAAPQVVVVQTTDILIFVLFALSLNLLVGYGVYSASWCVAYPLAVAYGKLTDRIIYRGESQARS